jgi:uncharacterized protein with HEPN domain
MRDTSQRLRDIQEAIDHITKYTGQGREAFNQNELIQIWVVRHLEIIGEAVRTLPQDLKDQHPAIPWAKINRMRNILVHACFGVDEDIVWEVVEKDLPRLKASIDALLDMQQTESIEQNEQE